MHICTVPPSWAGSGTVMLAHDTRPSAAELVQAAVAGVTALGSIPVACGLLTTPQLHWMVHPFVSVCFENPDRHAVGSCMTVQLSLKAVQRVTKTDAAAIQYALTVDCLTCGRTPTERIRGRLSARIVL